MCLRDPDKDYTIPQVKKMWAKNPDALLTLIAVGTKRGKMGDAMGQSELSRRIGVPQTDSFTNSDVSSRIVNFSKITIFDNLS